MIFDDLGPLEGLLVMKGHISFACLLHLTSLAKYWGPMATHFQAFSIRFTLVLMSFRITVLVDSFVRAKVFGVKLFF